LKFVQELVKLEGCVQHWAQINIKESRLALNMKEMLPNTKLIQRNLHHLQSKDPLS